MGNKSEAKPGQAFVRSTLERLFINRLLVLYTGAIFDDKDFLERSMKRLLDSQVAELDGLGLPEPMIKDIFRVLEAWGERDYQLILTYFGAEDKGPSYKLTFVDEMDSDPDVIAMRALQNKAEGNAD